MEWNDATFRRFYENGYEQPWRKEFLETRMANVADRFETGKSVLLIGGALGWGAKPLLKAGVMVYNFDTSNFIRGMTKLHQPGAEPQAKLPSGQLFDSAITEDAISTMTDEEIVEMAADADFRAKRVAHIISEIKGEDDIPERSVEDYKALLSAFGFGHHRLFDSLGNEVG